MKTYEIENLEKQVKQLETLNDQITADNNKGIELLNNQIKELWFLEFEKNKDLKDAINQLENSREYGFDQYGDLYRWYGFDVAEFSENLDYLSEYLDDFGYYLDQQNERIQHFCGDDYILINMHQKDVYQYGSIIIRSNQYETETERNDLIELHMEKTGCFPEVLKCDNYGYVRLVNIIGESK